MYTFSSINTSQVEQILRWAFSKLTVGGESRQIWESVRAPYFEGDETCNIGVNARNETIALMIAATEMAISDGLSRSD